MLEITVKYLDISSVRQIAEQLLCRHKTAIRTIVAKHVQCDKFFTCIAPDISQRLIDTRLSDGDIALAVILRDVPPMRLSAPHQPKGVIGFFSRNNMVSELVTRKQTAQRIVDNIVQDLEELGQGIDGFSDLPFVVTIPSENVCAVRNMQQNKHLYEKMRDLEWVDFPYTPDVLLWLRDVHESLKYCNTYQPDVLVIEEIIRWFNLDPECEGKYLPMEADALDEASTAQTVICHALHEIKSDGYMSDVTVEQIENLIQKYEQQRQFDAVNTA